MSQFNYIEDNINEFGVVNMWVNTETEYSTVTKRGTKVEIVNKPRWGLTCYMDNSVQSCLKDEKIYHEALVHPAMMSAKSRKRVCVIGGGEGATIREVFKFDDVEEVDMYEWDRDVVNLFKNNYTEWSRGAFEDNRLVVIYDDIFETIKEVPTNKYDVVIIDLFEPTDENHNKWQELLSNLLNWIHEDTTIVMYAGMRNILKDKDEQSYQMLVNIIKNQGDEWRGIKVSSYDKHIVPYKVFIPSFSGESVFILLKDSKNGIRPTEYNIESHLKDNLGTLMSYCTFNW